MCAFKGTAKCPLSAWFQCEWWEKKFTDLIWQSAAEANMMLNKSNWVFSKVSVLELNFLYFISQWDAVHRQIHQELILCWKKTKKQTNFGPHFNSRTQISEPPKLTLAKRLFSFLILQRTNCIYVSLYSKHFSCSYWLWKCLCPVKKRSHCSV